VNKCISVSIIMPLYNASKYLRQSLESIKKQTLEDFELICINDCSEDETVSIVETLMENDSRVKLLHNEKHSGAALSRNCGIEAAKGKYICFLDGDDIFEPCMLEKAVYVADENELDMVCFECRHTPSDRINEKKTFKYSDSFIEEYCRKTFSLSTCRKEIIWSIQTHVCDRLYRRDFINDCGIRFQDLPSSNDVFFSVVSILEAKKIRFVETNLVMIYARDHNSKSRISYNRDPVYVLKSINEIYMHAVENGKDEYYFNLIQYFAYMLILYTSKALNTEQQDAFIKLLNMELNKTKGLLSCFRYRRQNSFINDFINTLSEKGILIDFRFAQILDERKLFFSQLFTKGVALWGYGYNGQLICKAFDTQGMKINAIIDKNADTIVDNTPDRPVICIPDEIDNSIKTIIATNEEIYKDIYDICKSRNIQLINFLR